MREATERRGRGEDEKEAKGTETSLLCSFQQKPVNNAHYGIHGMGRKGRRGRGRVNVSRGGLSEA